MTIASRLTGRAAWKIGFALALAVLPAFTLPPVTRAAPQAAPPPAAPVVVPNVQNGAPVTHPNRWTHARVPGYTATELERIVPDPKLRIAFEMALSNDQFRTTLAPQFLALPRPLILVDNRGLLTHGAWASSLSRADLIFVSPDLYQEPPAVIAATIAHEAYHAVNSDAVAEGEPCFQDELMAHRWAVWVYFTTTAPIAFAPREWPTELARQLYLDALLMENGTFDAVLRERYAEQCAPRGAGTPAQTRP